MPNKLKSSLLILSILTLAQVVISGCGGNESSNTVGRDTAHKSNEKEKKAIGSASHNLQPTTCPANLVLSEIPQLFFCGSLHDSNCIYSYVKSDSHTYNWPAFPAIGDAHTPMKNDEHITIQDLITIYNIISSNSHYTNADSTKNVAALLMTYGLNETDDSLKIIYTPIILQNLSVSDISNGGTSAVEQLKNYTMYYIDTNRWIINKNNGDYILTPITVADSVVLVRNFRAKIRFRNESDNGTYRIFSTDDDFRTGDIKSTFMTFQQVFRMYCDNVNQTVDLQSNLTLMPVFTPFSGTNRKRRHKMHIVVYYNTLKEDSTTDPPASFVNLGADASQMCPPKCESFGTQEKIVRDLNKKPKKYSH